MIKNDVDGTLNITDKAMTILIRTDNLKKVHSYAANLQEDLPNAKVTTWDKHADYLNDIKSTFGFVLGIVQILSLIGAVVPVATVLYTNIINKTKDIGIYKAIGSNRGFILLLYSATCMVIGLLGVLIGWLIGGVMILYFQAYPLVFTSPGVSYNISPAFDAQAFLPPSILIFIAILLAGLYPAWKASRIEPVEAFRFG
jgi:putative ABC transport system permease protein